MLQHLADLWGYDVLLQEIDSGSGAVLKEHARDAAANERLEPVSATTMPARAQAQARRWVRVGLSFSTGSADLSSSSSSYRANGMRRRAFPGEVGPFGP